MQTPSVCFEKMKNGIKKEWKVAFVSAFLLGLLIHLPAMISDIPNHDGLDSLYFDQNMVTSGRWFLTVACGFSSYFTIPWMIGLLSMFYLACAAVVLTDILEIRKTYCVILVSGLLVAFPALTSVFAYVFTMDGYMLALLLAMLAVWFTKKYRYGFLAGAVCLAFSMGTYQAYLAFAVLLSIYRIIICMIETEGWKEKVKATATYLYMGVLGGGLYFVMLHLLLKIQGKQLASYQGISGMAGSNTAGQGILTTLKDMYADFIGFTFGNNVLVNNAFAAVAGILLLLVLIYIGVRMMLCRKWWKNPWFFVIMVLLAAGLPIATNLIMLVAPDVTYHLLMRYQWVLFLIFLIAFAERYLDEVKAVPLAEWGILLAGAVLVFNYSVTDNIAYSNLQKRYEKTYAYCVRLLDRIEQTEGYYQGIPVAMIGVVGDDEFPATDITSDVTAGMIGITGDSLLYTGKNYELFIRNYLGASLNVLEPAVMSEIYYSDEYIAMDSFPGENSTKVVDGILYVKTENSDRD